MPIRLLLPLLYEPPPPVLETQGAAAQGAADIAEAALWRYRLRYWHPHVAQDEVIVTASFNVPALDAAAGDGAPPRTDCRVSVRLDYSDDGERIDALRLTREEGESGPAGGWPDADFRGTSGEVIELGNGEGEGAVRTYAFDPPVPAEGWPSVGITWSSLDVARMQNARASLAAVRNRGLGADDAVYRTATLDAANIVAPLNRWPQDFDISDAGDTVNAALDAAFAALFGSRRIGQRVAMAMSYGYAVEPVAALMTYLPVSLLPEQPLTATTTAQVAQALAAWKAAYSPPATGAEWSFSLTQFSQIDTPARPLLELARLVYRLRPE